MSATIMATVYTHLRSRQPGPIRWQSLSDRAVDRIWHYGFAQGYNCVAEKGNPKIKARFSTQLHDAMFLSVAPRSVRLFWGKGMHGLW